MSGGTATKTSFTRGEDPLRADKLNTALSERVSRAGDQMDGYLALVGDPVAPFDAATKQYVDRWLGLIGPSGTAPAAFVGAAPPGNVPAPLWWDSNGGQLYVQYDDGSSVQWVLANAITGGPYLRLSGDTVSGPINVTVPGTPITRSVQAALSDVINVKSFGAIMDGNSHPLSSVYGTLAAAQVVYPHAQALTDEIDWCAIQGCVNAGNVAIRFPGGNAIINRPIVSSTAHIIVIGGGVDVSSITQTTVGADGWQHNSNMHFQIFGISLKCSGAGGVALNLNFTGATATLTIRDVSILGSGNQSTTYWHDGVRSIGPGLIVIDNLNIIGRQQSDLSTVGNGLYLAPRSVPTALGMFQVSISNSGISYWQNAMVFDSTTATNLGNNIQGVVLDWINSVGCMQFVRVVGVMGILELVITKCQNASYGSAIYAESAFSVVVRDSYFISYKADPTRAIVAQLPQDIFYAHDGGTWWIKDNRFQINTGSTWNYVFNFTNTFVGAFIRDNAIVSQGVTAMLGYINIAGGNAATALVESGSSFGFWDASWPKIVNGNVGGGAANVMSLGALATITAPTTDVWQQAGALVGYGYTAGRGATDFINSHVAALAGGFYFYNVVADVGQTPTQLAAISNNGIFTCNGLIAKSVPVTGTSYTLAVTDSSLVITPTGTFTLTLGTPTLSNTGRIVWIKSMAAFAINAAVASVMPLTGPPAATAILPATAGKWCVLQSDGTYWQIMQAN